MLRVGTDCSGLDAPIWTLKEMGVRFSHVFASETNIDCVKTILANNPPDRLYGDPESDTPNGDIMQRNHSHAPSCDLYVCGFPCQPFSVSGSMKGTDDTRGSVFRECINYITIHRPKWVVLENVMNLCHIQNGVVFKTILNMLSDIPGYKVSHSIMNTKDYGIPQSRNRLYIVCVRDAPSPFVFPPPVPYHSSPSAEQFVDFTDTSITATPRAEKCRVIAEELKRRNLPGVFFDALHMQRSKKDPIVKQGYPVVPCITCNSYHWNSIMNRRANITELLSLQGLPTTIKNVVTDTSMRRQIGNAMSCNVLRAIFTKLFEN